MTGASATQPQIPLRLAILGLGRMGRHHLTAVRERSDVRIVAIGDHGTRSARDVAADIGADCRVVTRASEVLGHTDAAIVAVPTAAHADVAIPLLEAGVACFVEKPIAASESEAERMIAAAHAGRTVLQVGHVERFNPAFQVLREQLGDGATDGGVRRICARRTSRPAGRTFDVDAVLDLMIHDLDLAACVTRRPDEPTGGPTFEIVEALAPDATFDRASVLLESGREGGRVALQIELVADRTADVVARTFAVESGTWLLHADLDARSLKRRPSSGRGPVEELAVPDFDSLRAQLDAFLGAVRGRCEVAVDGGAGLAALRLANRIRGALGLVGPS